MHFTNYLNNSKNEIKKELDGIFILWQEEIKNGSPSLLPLIKNFIDGMSGGKMLGATLVRIG